MIIYNMVTRKDAIQQFKAIERMIKDNNMRLAAQWSEDWKALIATIMSAVTRDEVTIVVCERLFRKYPSMKALGRAKLGDVEKIIRPVNFYRNKSRNVIATAKILSGKKIPDSVSELIKLPGVGRKVANVYLAEIHKASAIGVDTHVARISYKLGWTNSKNPHVIEKDLERLFPRSYWVKINETLVRFGKSYGTSRRREDDILRGIMGAFR